MAPQRFYVGQPVYLQSAISRHYAATGVYEVRAVLPDEQGWPRYRIKSLIEPHERVVSHNELSAAG
jgi:hypothetical protein